MKLISLVKLDRVALHLTSDNITALT